MSDDDFKKSIAVVAALELLEKRCGYGDGFEFTNEKWCKLAAILYGDTEADMQDHVDKYAERRR